MEDKIALVLDELTDKVLGFKTDNFYDYDIIADAIDAEKIRNANFSDSDVYYCAGKIEIRSRDPNEYHNRINNIDVKLSAVQAQIGDAMSEYLRTKSAAAHDDLKRLDKQKSELLRERNTVETAYAEKLAEHAFCTLKNSKYKYYCSLCLIIRDENEYLKEWLDWHIAQGVEHFYIYDNGSKLPVAEFIRDMSESVRDKITIIDYGGKHGFAQHEAYNDCLNRYKKESRWIGFIDTDEMIRVKSGESITQVLQRYEDHAGLFMRWIIYNANGCVNKSDKPLRERFTRESEFANDFGIGKVFVQPLLIRRMLTHNGFPIKGVDVVDERYCAVKRANSCKPDAACELICIDHYYTKSYEEWVEKMKRGCCDPYYNRWYSDFFNYNPDMEYCREAVIPDQKYGISNK